MIEDLTGNIRRVVDGIADEVAARVAGDLGGGDDKIRAHVRQVLYEWFLGEFFPRNNGPPE